MACTKIFKTVGYKCNINHEYITDLYTCQWMLCSALSILHKLYRIQMFFTIIVCCLLFTISVYNATYLLLDKTAMSSYYIGLNTR